MLIEIEARNNGNESRQNNRSIFHINIEDISFLEERGADCQNYFVISMKNGSLIHEIKREDGKKL